MPNESVDIQKVLSARPSFTFATARPDAPTKLVVDGKTTDNQLRSLLWYLRVQRAQKQLYKALFAEIRTTTPIIRDPEGGILTIYKSKRCVGEDLLGGAHRPCGVGGHFAASYIWSTSAEGGALTPSQTQTVDMFSSDDHWHLPADLQAEVDRQASQRQEALAKSAMLLNKRLDYLGGRYTAGIGPDATLVIRSEQLAHGIDRDRFMQVVYPSWKKDLCDAGFQTIRLRPDSLIASGTDYSVECVKGK